MGTQAVHPAQRFWSKVTPGDPSDCWEWRGARHPSGYGFLYAGSLYQGNKRFVRAHRLSWEIHNGASVPKGLCVLHHCDNPPCVNPAHLYVGDRADNARDRAERNRGKQQHGETNDNAKLTEAQVREIDELVKGGATQMEVAARFGIKQPQVSRIIRRETWREIWRDD
jgi:predicted XRE-type DNA-binding protein